jgi:hydrogenase expression/formation protein HypE
VPDDAREASVLDRIESFRRRRPRFNDEVITLAHGAGGKSSAALVDAVFLEAFAGDDKGPLPDAATLTLLSRCPERFHSGSRLLSCSKKASPSTS